MFNYVTHNQGNNIITGLEHMVLELFQTFGFLDYMYLSICKPDNGTFNPDSITPPATWQLQRAF